MWLQNLSIKTFRNYKETKIDFNPKLNVFLGRNAQGKTNMLEAILKEHLQFDENLLIWSLDKLSQSIYLT